MRLLWARVGMPYSPATGLPIVSQTVSQMVDRVMAMPEGTRLYLLAPIVRGRKGEYRKELIDLRKRGFQRVKIDGKMVEIDEARPLNKKLKHDIAVVVDRIVVARRSRQPARRIRSRRRSSSPTASPSPRTPIRARRRSSRRNSPARSRASRSPRSSPGCSRSTTRSAPARPATGSAPSSISIPGLVVHDERRSLAEGAVSPWSHSSSQYYTQTLESIARHFKQSMHTPWPELPEKMRQTILSGSDGEPVQMTYDDGLQEIHDRAPVRGRAAKHGAALSRDRQRLGQGGIGPLPERPDLRGVPGRPAEARGVGGQDRRPQHQRGRPPVDFRRAAMVLRHRCRAEPEPARDRRAHPARRSTSGSAFCRMSGSNT